MKRITSQESFEISNRLSLAFALMRKSGLIARQNFSCCGSCASYELATKFGEMDEKKRAKVNGFVTFNRQRTQGLHDYGTVHLQYGSLEYYGPTPKKDENGRSIPEFVSNYSTIDVGKIVVNCLEGYGLEVEWNGTEDQCIYVNGLKKPLIDMEYGI